MTIAELVPIALRSSIFGIVLALGLHTTLSEATWVLRKPKPLLLGLVSMFVVMPIVAAGLAYTLDLTPAVKVALVALAFSPVPPILPKKEFKAGAGRDQVMGLLVAASVLSIAVVPLGVNLVTRAFGLEGSVAPATIAAIVWSTVLLPLVVGIVGRRLLPDLAEKIADPLMKVATLLLVVGLLPILITSLPAMGSLIGEGTLAAMAVFVVIGLMTGHVLAGERGDHRTVLALSTATRHPGVALAIAASVAPETPMVAPAVLLYLLVGALLSGVYLAIRRKRESAPVATG